MDYISIILLVVVLVAQIILFTLYFLEKRYDSRRYSALLQYIDRRVEDADCRDEVEESVKEILDAYTEKMNGRFKRQDELNAERFSRYHDAFMEMKNRVNEQIGTIRLDYAEAQQAADKVNNFASSLASIFDYDPLKAIQRDRKKEAI